MENTDPATPLFLAHRPDRQSRPRFAGPRAQSTMKRAHGTRCCTRQSPRGGRTPAATCSARSARSEATSPGLSPRLSPPKMPGRTRGRPLLQLSGTQKPSPGSQQKNRRTRALCRVARLGFTRKQSPRSARPTRPTACSALSAASRSRSAHPQDSKRAYRRIGATNAGEATVVSRTPINKFGAGEYAVRCRYCPGRQPRTSG